MEDRQVRNEFGLDEYNAMDVRRERAKQLTKLLMPWILGAVAIVAVFGLLGFFVSGTDTRMASDRPAATTTGSGAQVPQPTPR
jgi:hypothetical protein